MEGARSLTSPMRSKTGGAAESWRESGPSSSSEERSTTKRSPRKAILRKKDGRK